MIRKLTLIKAKANEKRTNSKSHEKISDTMILFWFHFLSSSISFGVRDNSLHLNRLFKKAKTSEYTSSNKYIHMKK